MSNNKKHTVLVLDDESFIRESLVDFLEDADFTVFSAPTAEDALKVISKNHVDVSIVDIRLPGRDGNFFVMESARMQPGISYIIHTGSVNYTIDDDIRSLGINQDNVINKPVTNLSVFLDKISLMIEKKAL